ncbi:MAG: DUF1275 domain-containing protein [Sphingomonadaceae bacterium]|nr:DUF1275 domain-containing protein [Sphingomonadaceae bacterium]
MTRLDQPRRLLAFAIAALAGMVDATGFLAADSYFVSFMSGNTTRLAVDLATNPMQALVPLGLIAGFLSGVFFGALLADRAGRWRKTALLCVVASLLALSALALLEGHKSAMIAPAVLAMGAINNAFARERGVTVGLTYMTGALVRLGQGLADRIAGKPSPGLFDNLLLWLSLVSGAIGGAFAYLATPSLGVWLGAVFAGLLALAAFLVERRKA